MSRLFFLRQKRAKHKSRTISHPGKRQNTSRILFALTLLLTGLGLIAVFDVSSPQAIRLFGDPYYFAKQQLMWAGIGLGAFVGGSVMSYKLLSKYALVIFGVSLLLLLIVLIPGIGSNVLGARRWIRLGPVGIQPSEVAKLAVIIIIAKFAEAKYPVWYGVSVLGIVSTLIMLQPDLGTTIVVASIGLVQLFAAGYTLVNLGAMAAAGTGLAGLLVIFSDYRRQRLMTFINNLYDPLSLDLTEAYGAGYHIRQILIAIGSGGILGLGVGQSRQKHLFLPETATDSVFAIIAEEFGFIGAATLIILLMYFTLVVVRVAMHAPDKFSAILAIGIAGWIGGQTILNLSAMLALAPLTGIPLPFFSYGGSSLTMTLFSVGILVNIGNSKK